MNTNRKGGVARVVLLAAALVAGCGSGQLDPGTPPTCAALGFQQTYWTPCSGWGEGPRLARGGWVCGRCGGRPDGIPDCTLDLDAICVANCSTCAPEMKGGQ
jgi:hypothetical protein